MKRQFKHLSKTQRNQLEMLLRVNVSKKEIADYLGVSLSTVYREIKRGAYMHRNTDWTETLRYSADKAEINYPREIFDFETSNERFAREIAKIA